MGLMSKLKNILFEEEEVEIPVIDKKEKKVNQVKRVEYQEMPKKEEIEQAPDYSNFYQKQSPVSQHLNEQNYSSGQNYPKQQVMPREQEIKQNYRQEYANSYYENKSAYSDSTPSRYQEEQLRVQKQSQGQSMKKNEQSFHFPDFDEDEFESALPKREKKVVEVERKKEVKKERIQPIKKEEVVTTPKTKFRPSPIISPVYGILDKNYTPDEITTREATRPSKTLDVESVRKKAFGVLEEDTIKIPIKNDLKEEEFLEEKLEKARTIDELLKDSSDEEIEVESIKQEETEEEVLDDVIDSLENKEDVVRDVSEDTLESDLFDLIDSMYENREE